MTKYYGHYNEVSGDYLGFYPDDIWDFENIPTPNIELTKEEWEEAIQTRCSAKDGKHKIKPFTVDEVKSKDEKSARANRDNLLRESDWTQLLDSPLSESEILEWRTYRQGLRDAMASEPYDLPTKPIKK